MPWSKAIWELTGKRGVDVIVDHVGEATFKDSVRSLRKGGRVVVPGATGGPRPARDETPEPVLPRKARCRGGTGPGRRSGRRAVEPVGDGARVTLELAVEGRGLRKRMVPFVRRQARPQVPMDHAQRKRRL